MGKRKIADAFLALKDESVLVPKLMAKSVKKHRAIHELRILFKKMKAHIALFSAISGTDFSLSPGLREYYQQIGRLRDAKIFYDLCAAYTNKNKVFMVLGNERIVHAKDKLKKFIASVDIDQLTKELTELIDTIVSTSQNLESERVKAGLETFLERQENLIKQLLQSIVITDVCIHSVRKQMKKVLYLLPYLTLYDAGYTSRYKTYKILTKKLGEWNDLNLLVKELHPLPRSGKEQKIVSELVKKEAKTKKKLLKNIRAYFDISSQSLLEATKWTTQDGIINEENVSEMKDIVDEEVTEVSETPPAKTTRAKPARKTPVKKTPVRKITRSRAGSTKTPSTRKPRTTSSRTTTRAKPAPKKTPGPKKDTP